MTNSTVWKFPVCSEVRMPKGAKLLTLQVQHGMPHLWAEVDPSAEEEKRRFAVVGTGSTLPEPRTYVGTYQNSPFIWHVYEVEQ